MSAIADGEIRTIGGLAVTLHGPADAPPVLLSAGLGGQGTYWWPQLEALSRRHRVILYDHRGTGLSDRHLPDTYCSVDLGLDLQIILDGLSLPSAHLVGHAAGAVAAFELALLAPERVRTVTAVNGWALADAHFKRCFEIRLGIYKAGGAEAYLRAQPLFLFPADWISDHLDELDAQAAHHAETFQDETTLTRRISALVDFNIEARLPEIVCPILAIAAEDDMLVPSRCSRQLCAGLPNARIVMMRRGGHAINLTQPVDFNAALLGFLEEQDH